MRSISQGLRLSCLEPEEDPVLEAVDAGVQTHPVPFTHVPQVSAHFAWISASGSASSACIVLTAAPFETPAAKDPDVLIGFWESEDSEFSGSLFPAAESFSAGEEEGEADA